MAFIFTNTNITNIGSRTFANVGVLDCYFDNSKIERISVDKGPDVHAFSSKNLRKVSFKGCTSLINIHYQAFGHNTNLTNVDFTGCTSLQNIYAYAFTNTGVETIDLTPCTALTKIDIGAFNNCPFLKTFDAHGLENLTTLGNASNTNEAVLARCPMLESVDFHGCTSLKNTGQRLCCEDKLLTSVNFSGCSSLEEISTSSFAYCSALNTVNLTGCTSLAHIKGVCFRNCQSLETIIGWEDAKQTIQDFTSESFYQCTSLDIDLSNMPELIKFDHVYNNDMASFSGCTSLTTTLENCPKLQTIGRATFYGCTSLGDIDLHGNTSLTTIGQSAFQNAKAVHVNLNNCSALTTIGQSAWNGARTEEFYMNDCTALTTIGGHTTVAGMLEGAPIRIFEAMRCINLQRAAPRMFAENKTLQRCLFTDCTSLYEIEPLFARGVNSPDAIFNFDGCTSLRNIGYNAFGQNTNNTISFNSLSLKNTNIETISSEAFRKVGFNVISIHDFTDEVGLVDFSNSATLQKLDTAAFANSRARIVKLNNCEGLTTINNQAFYQCGIYYLDVDGTNNITTIGGHAFNNYTADVTHTIDKYADFVVPKLNSLGTYAFGSENKPHRVVRSINATGAPLTEIPARVWYNNSAIQSIIFDNCPNLTTIGQREAGDSAHWDSALTIISFKNCTSLTNTGLEAWYKCANIETADFTGCTSLKQVDKDTFFECTKVNVIGVEDWPVETIGQAAFNMCQAQPTLKFTNSNLTVVNNQAFRGCNGCSEIELHFNPAVETAVYHQAFTGCGANTGGCDIKLYCGNIMPTVTLIGDDETSGTGSATWRISFGTNSGTTFHFPIAAEANAKSTARSLEDDTKTKRDGTTPTTGNIAWWCCSNGGLTTTTGGSDGTQEARVNLWYTGTPTLAFDL